MVTKAPPTGSLKSATQVQEVYGDVPLPRFGHSITLVSKTKVVLFGGATGDTGRYSMTGDTFIFNVLTRTWVKLEARGISPSPRAAHASTNVDSLQLVVYGGATGGGSLASDDLYLLDMRQGETTANWMIVPIVGKTPGRRYGHTIVFVKPFLITFGGNTGSEPVGDVWCLSVDKAPFSWTRLECSGESPPVRVYHSAAICSTGTANGMMVLFGGRTADQSALNDTWGLRKHRDGRWDWVKAPYKSNGVSPTSRYQHSLLFMGAVAVVVGGRTNNVGETVPLEIYDTETSEWHRFPSLQRFRHASWIMNKDIFAHGGFEHDSPNIPTKAILKIDLTKVLRNSPYLLERGEAKRGSGTSKEMTSTPKQPHIMKNVGPKASENKEIKLSSHVHVARQDYSDNYPAGAMEFASMVRMVSIGKLPQENKKIITEDSAFTKASSTPSRKAQEAIANAFIHDLLRPKTWGDYMSKHGKHFPFAQGQILNLIQSAKEVVKREANVIKLEPPCKVFGNLHGQYQDLMRFFDVYKGPMSEAENGDIESFGYLFLGNYVDRGCFSLEVICLLMALKVKYCSDVFLLRGAHEDRLVNETYGFLDECNRRLDKIPGEKVPQVYTAINEFFELLPMAGIIGNQIFCAHSGIGSSINKFDEINHLQRPFQIPQEVTTPEQQMVVDLLWSDPDDSIPGVKPHTERDPKGIKNIVKYGPDRVIQFLQLNGFSKIIRSHESVIGGFAQVAEGDVITLTSCTDYCGQHGNLAALCSVNKALKLKCKALQSQTTSSVKMWEEDQRSVTPPKAVSSAPTTELRPGMTFKK